MSSQLALMHKSVHRKLACNLAKSQTWNAGYPRVARRLDIKVYRSQLRVTAVNYFTGSQIFNRALRYWCKNPPQHVQALAAKHFAGANRFKLSDKVFFARCADEEAEDDVQGGASSGAHCVSLPA